MNTGTTTHYKAVIIGSGQGGTPLAKKLAKRGWTTALVEREYVGGTCTNVGCTPAKALLASAKTTYTVEHAADFGIDVPDVTVDMPAVLARKNRIVTESREGEEDKLEQITNLTLLRGEASFTAPKSLCISYTDGQQEMVTGEFIFIDTGTSPQVPKVEGLEEAGYLTSTTVMELAVVPPHLLIIGGNYIGLEFGQTFHRLGSKVTIVEHGKRLLEQEDEDIAAEVSHFLKEDGITFLLDAEAKKVKRVANGLEVTVSIGENESKVVHCTHILAAAGVMPNSKALNLAAAGIETDEKGYVKVNEYLETNVKGVYALGDITGGPAYNHIAHHDHLILYNNLFEENKMSTTERLIAYCMFTDPQLGRVGMSETEARKKGLPIKVATYRMEHLTRSRTSNNTTGLMKAIVHAESGEILGASIVGAEGGETMAVVHMAMAGKVPYQTIAKMPIAHPLYAKGLNNLFLGLKE